MNRRWDKMAVGVVPSVRGLCLSVFALLIAALNALAADSDKDGLEDSWQTQYGFSTNGYAPANLVGWWQMDDGSKTNALDRSGRALHGRLTNFVSSPFVPGLYTNALSFSTNSHVVFPTTNSVLSITNSFTISGWFRASSTNKATTIAQWSALNGRTWKLGIHTNGAAQIQFTTPTNVVQTIRSGAGLPSLYDNQWHQLAAVYDKSVSRAILYVDGTAEANVPVTNWVPNAVQTFTFGAVSNAVFVLDEARLYNVVIPPNGMLELPATYSDHDGDGLTNLQEFQGGTNPLQWDTDGDGMDDGWEFTTFGNQNQTANGDFDADGMSNLYEYVSGLNPKVADSTADKDGDGVINQEDAGPNNSSIGRMTVTITTPANGSTVN